MKTIVAFSLVSVLLMACGSEAAQDQAPVPFDSPPPTPRAPKTMFPNVAVETDVVEDAGSSDATSEVDAGEADAGTETDSGETDAGTEADGGEEDAGDLDAGTDEDAGTDTTPSY